MAGGTRAWVPETLFRTLGFFFPEAWVQSQDFDQHFCCNLRSSEVETVLSFLSSVNGCVSNPDLSGGDKGSHRPSSPTQARPSFPSPLSTPHPHPPSPPSLSLSPPSALLSPLPFLPLLFLLLLSSPSLDWDLRPYCVRSCRQVSELQPTLSSVAGCLCRQRPREWPSSVDCIQPVPAGLP